MSITGYPMGRAHVTRVSLVSLCKWFGKKTIIFSLQLPHEYDFIQKHSLPLLTPLSSFKSCCCYKNNENINNLSPSLWYPQSCNIPLQWLTGRSSICDSHKSTHASKETSELKGCGTLSRAVRGTFKKSLTSPFLNLNSSAFVVSPKFSLFLEFLGMRGLHLQQEFSFERKVCSLSELRCEHVSEEILISR